MRRLDLQLAKAYPPKEDACCSARSYSENDLIALREDSIATKEAQIVRLIRVSTTANMRV